MITLKKIWQKVFKNKQLQQKDEVRLPSRQEKLSEWRKTAGRSIKK